MRTNITTTRSLLGRAAVALAVGTLLASACSSAETTTPTTVETTSSTTSTTTPTVTIEEATVIYDFSTPESAAGWTTVNDTVMGGVSTATAVWNDGALVFSGTVSLDNNGGFTSMVGPFGGELGAAVATQAGISLVGSGDDKTYVVQLRTPGGGFIQRFDATGGPQAVWELPFAGFTAVDFMLDPRPGAAPLDPAAINQLAVYLLDKQEGPFSLSLTGVLGLGS